MDVVATGLFGFEGAIAGAVAGLDILGVIVVGMATAVGGGIVRDVLLGDLPPAAFGSPVRIVVALISSLLGFVVAASPLHPTTLWLGVLDALALGLFAATGAQKALGRGSNGWVVVFLGTVTAVGGGVIRDVLMSRVPVVLSANVYAVAAAAGAAVYLLCARLRLPGTVVIGLSVAACFALRVAAIVGDWQLPHLSDLGL